MNYVGVDVAENISASRKRQHVRLFYKQYKLY